MIIVVSPAKSLYEFPPVQIEKHTEARFLTEAAKIVAILKKKKAGQLADLMGISAKLAELNFQRFQVWKLPFTPENSWQAILMFNGDVYQGLQAETFTKTEFDAAQNHLRILSGVYGLLRPLDLIQPYRLEMGTNLAIGQKKNLYEFWKAKITNSLNQEMKEAGKRELINLASAEYFGAIDTKKLKARIITPAFKEQKGDQFQMVSFFAKRARGLMSRYIIENQITNSEDIKGFSSEGYYFNNQLSKGDNWVFTR